MSLNNKTNRLWMSQDLKRHKPSQKSVNHETHSLYCIQNQSKSDFV